jgi:hypothetical protein
MDKASFSFVVRKRDSAGAYRVNSGPLWGGVDGRVGLRVERIENLHEFTKAPCEVVVYEVDGKGRRWSRKTEVARFDVKIRRQGTKFHFTVNGRKDTRTYRNDLPSPGLWEHWYQQPWKLERRKPYQGPWAKREVTFTTTSWPGWRPAWQPAHFFLDFNTAGNTFDRETRIVIPSTSRQEGTGRRGPGGRKVTDFFYTIGFEVLVGGEKKYRSLALPLDCHNLLAHNLGVAASGMLMAHREVLFKDVSHAPPSGLIPQRAGTHFGTDWLKSLPGGVQHTVAYTFAEAKKLQFTSCMQYPLDVGEIGFAKTFGAPRAGRRPRSAIWSALRRGQPSTFIPIAKRLVERGWVSVYFNPDTVNPHSADEITKKYHLDTARLAMREPGTYLGIPVHDRFVDYKLSTPRSIAASRRNRLAEQRAYLARLTFAFIVTSGAQTKPGTLNTPEHLGHCAMLVGKQVHEVHYDRSPAEADLFDDGSELEEWNWGSGLLVIPRGQWVVR